MATYICEQGTRSHVRLRCEDPGDDHILILSGSPLPEHLQELRAGACYCLDLEPIEAPE